MGIYKEISGHGIDIVLLHGWSCNQRHMQPIVDQLKDRYRVTNVNLPGISHSTWYPEINTIHDFADKIIDDLPENAIYIGWSFGGLVSMSIAARYPERVKRFIGITTTPKFIEENNNWPGVAKPGFIAGFEEVRKKGFVKFFKDYYDNEFINTNPKPAEYYQLLDIVDDLAKTVNLDILLKGIQICDAADLRKEYQAIKCPIDLILGANDESLPRKMHNSIKLLNPKANIHVLENVNHLPFWTHPQEFNPLFKRIIFQ